MDCKQRVDTMIHHFDCETNGSADSRNDSIDATDYFDCLHLMMPYWYSMMFHFDFGLMELCNDKHDREISFFNFFLEDCVEIILLIYYLCNNLIVCGVSIDIEVN